MRKEDTPVTYRPMNGDRINPSVSSVDWKAWLSANVAKLQPSPSPTRDSEIVYAVPGVSNTFGQGHVRETAQIGSGQDTPPTHASAHRRTLPGPPLTPTPTGSDIIKSPPFGMRSSILKRTPPSEGLAQAACPQKRVISPLEPLPFPDFGPAPPVPPRSPLRTSSYTASLNNAKSMSHLRETNAPDTKPLQESPSLAHARSVNQLAYAANANLGSPQTPTIRSRGLKLQKKRSGFLYTPSVANSSPGLTAAVEKQFGPASRLPSKLGEGKENIMTPAAKLFTPEAEVRSARSKMVDVFLSSRRKRMASSSNGTATHDESAAFV
ncbi:hypothetical protein DL546_002792 [Coniochaeta pulveracea]|uniref:Uncharacterized protein n=1 Tax=Coniochaeta pulveracea TaxID=177199 RepID=A0A420YCI5_9PEZI|nr:hypothetical protein DL546_002792 [Coniochaeta pulveracea]